MSGSSTAVMELPSRSHSSDSHHESSGKVSPHTECQDVSAGALPPPSTATPQLQKWNTPRINMYRVLATFYSFVILGANDGAYGALIPYLETWYHINYTIVSLVFLSPILGYSLCAVLINHIHKVYGQRGIAVIMASSHLFAYVVICVHPPFPVLVVVFIIAGFGNGLGDSGWNAWIGDMAHANEVLGFLHAFYGLGAAVSPLVATALVTKAGWRWYEFYYLMVAAAATEAIFLIGTFWRADGKAYRAEHPQILESASSNETTTPTDAGVNLVDGQVRTRRKKAAVVAKLNALAKERGGVVEAVRNKVTILTAIFLLVYVGVEVSIGGWIVTFMLRVRKGSPFASGLISTGFWLGITLGRLVLGFVTARLFRSEKHAVATYLVLSVALQLMFWLIPQFVVSAVMVGFLGFFLGPMFPAAVVVLTKLLPKRLHVPAVGFAAALGASGACVLPFATGAIANAKGVQVLQPIILASLVVCLVMWLLIPTLPKQRLA